MSVTAASSIKYSGAVPQGNTITSEDQKSLFKPVAIVPNPKATVDATLPVNDESIKELNTLIYEYCALNSELEG